ncbi:MAG: SdiA-regulated domain-containing protein [Chitinophagales bacterium]
MPKYDLTKVDKKLVLSKKLLEISGLSYFGKGRLAAINDEEALVYIIDGETGKIIDKVDFGKKRDYEGIAIAENNIYVIEGKGVIYKINKSEYNKKVQKYRLPFSVKNDMESLCYYAKKNILLTACKEQTGYKTHEKSWRYIYSFDLSKEKILKDIFLKISEQEIGDFLGQNMIGKFKPSGIAVSPIDNNIYIVSSVGKALAIYSENLKFKAAFRLPRHLFAQPEGITFDEKGNLYISNEGRKERGNILVFERR